MCDLGRGGRESLREEERVREGEAERGRENREEGERKRKINNLLFTHDFASKT